MGLAFVMGTCVSTLILLLIFFLIITPVGLVMKMMGRDALRLKKSRFPGDTYWVPYDEPRDKSYYERLF